ncbi:MAG TPA: DNA replication and repair protein RecF [Gemmatimonadaceae bacterium]|nr:DNA replication and repair protein RecF [Gemmatimonadaceae bacterium]
MSTTISDTESPVVAPGRIRLRSIDIRDFRNLEHVQMDVPAAGFVLIGDNGQGKTSFLEAVQYLEVLRSMRGARDVELIRFGEAAFHIGATVESTGGGASRVGDERTAMVDDSATPDGAIRRVGAGYARAGRRKKVTMDDVEVSRLADALGAVPSVVVSPRDVVLVAGAPTERRRFMDIVLALTRPGYLRALQGYRAALARRNAALRHGAHAETSAAVWEPAMAEHGAVLMVERRRWVAAVRDRASRLALAIGEEAPLTMRYQSALDERAANEASGEDTADRAVPDDRSLARESLERALEAKRSLDVRRGLTHAGPHRDDLDLLLGGRSLRAFGSAGQQRSAALVLRLLEAFSLHESLGRHPVMLLDDPFAELDARRAARVLTLLATDTPGQVVFAVPRAADVPEAMATLPRYEVRAGDITRLTAVGG